MSQANHLCSFVKWFEEWAKINMPTDCEWFVLVKNGQVEFRFEMFRYHCKTIAFKTKDLEHHLSQSWLEKELSIVLESYNKIRSSKNANP